MKLPAIAVTAIAITALVGGTAAAQATMQPVPNPPGPATTPMGGHHHMRHHGRHHHMHHHMHHHHMHRHHHMGTGPAPAEPAPEAPAPAPPPSM
ncbi:MAG TPA: hypothetical protein VG166_08055 [Caulobacteraceae bacterium]|nr:hypothetical protein [Caulobacteraceae bacterium]